MIAPENEMRTNGDGDENNRLDEDARSTKKDEEISLSGSIAGSPLRCTFVKDDSTVTPVSAGAAAQFEDKGPLRGGNQPQDSLNSRRSSVSRDTSRRGSVLGDVTVCFAILK
jgi:hypothetical protein